jgi:hypothetical protein
MGSEPSPSDQMTKIPLKMVLIGQYRMEVEMFFDGYEEARHIFEVLRRAIESLPSTTMSIMKSQVAFRRRKAFAWVWIPAKYLRGKSAPLVLTLSLHHRDPSPRWKEVVEPVAGQFTHHMELYSSQDVDAEVQAWMQEAWATAG